jgi:hypothetical protein
MTTFKPARLAILAAIGGLALGSAACAYDDYGDHHHRGGHDRGEHGGRGGHDRDHDGHGDHRGGH